MKGEKLIFWAGIALVIAMNSQAKKPETEDALMKADLGSETTSGGSNYSSALGNGRLTVGISPWSELVYFRWPSPGFYDHLRYLTKAKGILSGLFPEDMRYGKDAPGLDWRRYGRPYEVYPGLGAKAGIYFEDKSLSWLGDESWTSARWYEPESGPVLCTELKQAKAKIKVCQWVDWEEDLLVQDFQIESNSLKNFFYYGTFDPMIERWKSSIKFWGEPDYKDAGFATIYLPEPGVILYFYPEKKNENRIRFSEKFTAEKIDQLYPEGGIFIALGLDSLPDGFQVGADRKGRIVPKSAPVSASEDAMDGKLSGSFIFIGQADAGLEKMIIPEKSRVQVFIGVAKDAQSAISLIEKARAKGIQALREKVVLDWKGIAEQVNLPELAGAVEKKVARRSILNLFIGRDRETGAIVASPSRQPAYHFDWPRDGSFYDLALDLAGFPEIAGSHLDFYRRTQRKENLDSGFLWLLGGKSPIYSPCGHWFSNIYTDGAPGRLKIIPVEIDETALLVWDLWRHEQFVPLEQRIDYQIRYREMLELGADALCRYVDENKGWTKKVFEDDNAFPHATLHGASSVLAGLASAVDAGARWGVEKEKVERWRKKAIALREGILRSLEDEKILEKGGWRGIQWSLFPAPVFENFDDPRAQKLIQKLEKEIEEKAFKKRAGFAYLGEQLFILGIATANHSGYQDLLKSALAVLVQEVPFPGTDCYGEVTLWIDFPGESEKIAQQRTSIPHLWTGVTSYLSVEAIYRPKRFLRQIPPIPK